MLHYFAGFIFLIFPIYWLVSTCVTWNSNFRVPSEHSHIGVTPSYESLASKKLSINNRSNGIRRPGFESWQNLSNEGHISPIFKRHQKKKFILYLNWPEIHKERKTYVVQNKYTLGKFGTDPFQGKYILVYLNKIKYLDKYFTKIKP